MRVRMVYTSAYSLPTLRFVNKLIRPEYVISYYRPCLWINLFANFEIRSSRCRRSTNWFHTSDGEKFILNLSFQTSHSKHFIRNFQSRTSDLELKAWWSAQHFGLRRDADWRPNSWPNSMAMKSSRHATTCNDRWALPLWGQSWRFFNGDS